MNLYLISQSANDEYDTFDSAVVAAETEEEARLMHPNGYGNVEDYSSSWCAPEFVDVSLIGVAEPPITRSVICASFNAG